MSLKLWFSYLNQRNTHFFVPIPRFFKALILFLVVVGIIIFSQSTFAADSIIKQKQTAIKDGSNQEAWLDEALGSNLVSGIRTMAGDIPENILNGETDPDNLTYLPGGALGGTSQLISSLYNPPVSGIEYIAQIKDDFLGKPAYAQGTGFSGLTPILDIWRVFRNVVYILSSLVFIVIGLMIVLRIKINPQTVIGLQNVLPQIVITLILVTFSYAIAGLLIDMVYFIQSFFVALLFQATGTDLGSNLWDPNVFGKIRQTISRIIPGLQQYSHLYSFQNVSNPGFLQFYEMVKAILPTGTLFLLGTIIGAIIGTILGAVAGGAGAVPGAIVGLGFGGALIILIFQIIILICLLKFFFGLVKAYITILLKIIIAPLEIGAGAIPNSKLNFSSWLNDIVANLAIFPISVIFIVLLNLIVRRSGLFGGIWVPSLVGVVNNINLVPAIIGFGGILLLPKLPDLIPQLIFQIKPSPWGNALGQTFKEISTPVKAGGNLYVQNRANREATAYGSSSTHNGGETLRHSFWDMLGNFGVIKRK